MGFLDKTGVSKLWQKISDTFSRQDHQHDYTPEGIVDVEIQESENGNYTPSGTISTPQFTGNTETVNVSGEIFGTISTPEFTGNPISIPYITIDNYVDTIDFIPNGSVSAPAISVSSDTEEFVTDIIVDAPIVENGISLNHTYDSESQCIEISLNNDLTILPPATTISKSNSITAVNVTASAPEFIGSTTSINVTVPVADVGYGTITPTGTISTPEFTGSANLTGTITPTGTISTPEFTGKSVMVSTTFSGIPKQTEKPAMNKIISS